MISKTTIKVDKVFIMRALSVRKHDDLSINKWFINVFAKVILMSPTSTTVQTTTDSVLCIGWQPLPWKYKDVKTQNSKYQKYENNITLHKQIYFGQTLLLDSRSHGMWLS